MLAALAVGLWLILANTLRIDWSTNPQYNYGWGVLPLAAYLFLRRWPDRPAVEAAAAPRPGLLLALAGGALLLLLLPIRLLQEGNPDWRFINWAHGLIVTALALGALLAWGGRAWLRHFWLPVCFLLLAVAWPSTFEKQLTELLMRGVAATTVEALNFLGIIARQRGNLIELTTGVVGINEACSGVRSLQSTLMMAVFLGEYHRFTTARRALLVAGGVSLALLFNVARSFTVTLVCVKQGTAAANAWHDPAGYAVFALAFAGLLGLCAWLQRRAPAPSAAAPPSAPALPTPPSARLLWVVAAWVLFIEAGTELWYRAHEWDAHRNALWTLAWPQDAAGFQAQPMDEVVQRTLRYSSGSSARWRGGDQTAWLGFFFRWEPGRTSTLRARNHTPDICMPASGLQLSADHGLSRIPAAGLEIPFRGYTFTMGPQTLYLFYCVWEDQPVDDPNMGRGESMTTSGRLQAVRAGRRNLGQQVLQVAVAGPPDYETARARFATELNRLIRVMPGTARAGRGALEVAGDRASTDSSNPSWIATH